MKRGSWITKLVLVGMVVMFFAGEGWGQDSLNVNLAGLRNFVNYAFNVTVNDDIAYLSAGEQGLWTVDISNPVNPVEIGCIALHGNIVHTVVSNDIAYCAAQSGGVRIVDVSDPENMIEISSFDPEGYVNFIQLEDYLAYLANGTDGLRIMDISNPSQPVELSCLSFGAPEGVHAAGVSGDYAYVCYAECGCGFCGYIYTVDVSNPVDPIVVDSLYTGFQGNNIQIVGHKAYIGTTFYGMKIMDISNPVNPAIIGGYSVSYYDDYTNVDVVGDTVYCSFSESNLVVLDASNPYNPSVLAELQTPGYTYGLEVYGESVITTGPFDALSVVDLSYFPNLYISGAWDNSGDLYAMDIQDDLIYAVDALGGAAIINSSGTGYFDLVGTMELGEEAHDILTDGDYCYIAGKEGNLYIFDVSDPSLPVLIHLECIYEELHDIVKSGDYLYITGDQSYDYCMFIIDVTNPANPHIDGSFDPYLPGYISEMLIFENNLFFTQNNAGLIYLDISNPVSPAQIWNIGGDDYYGMAMMGDTMIVAKGSAGIDFIDLSDITDPSLIGEFDPGTGHVKDVRVEGNFAFLRMSSNGLKIVDCSDVNSPIIIGWYDLSGTYLYDFEIESPYAYCMFEEEVYKLDFTSAVGVDDIDHTLAQNFSLSPIHPNPFNQKAVITFNLEKAGEVKLGVYDVLGREVSRFAGLQVGKLEAGQHEVVWDAEGVSSGVYYIRLSAVGSQQSVVRKAVLLK